MRGCVVVEVVGFVVVAGPTLTLVETVCALGVCTAEPARAVPGPITRNAAIASDANAAVSARPTGTRARHRLTASRVTSPSEALAALEHGRCRTLDRGQRTSCAGLDSCRRNGASGAGARPAPDVMLNEWCLAGELRVAGVGRLTVTLTFAWSMAATCLPFG